MKARGSPSDIGYASEDGCEVAYCAVYSSDSPSASLVKFIESRRESSRCWRPRPRSILYACHRRIGLRSCEEIEKALEIAPTDMTIQHRAAQVYHLTGQTETALRLLKRSVEGGYPRLEIAADPLFAGLSGDPGFDALVDESRP